jgi:hypothetical protein
MRLRGVSLQELQRQVTRPFRGLADCQSTKNRATPQRHLEAAQGRTQSEPLLAPIPSAGSVAPGLPLLLPRLQGRFVNKRESDWKTERSGNPGDESLLGVRKGRLPHCVVAGECFSGRLGHLLKSGFLRSTGTSPPEEWPIAPHLAPSRASPASFHPQEADRPSSLREPSPRGNPPSPGLPFCKQSRGWPSHAPA